jgi:hypothetical protein
MVRLKADTTYQWKLPRVVTMSSRRIRRLHVRAGSDDDARQAVTLLTDALHSASLPLADQGRMIVIRRLALGRISVRVSPASLALHIERVMHDVVSEAVSYDHPDASAANAVAFPDRGEAIVTLARLHARGTATDAWFWGEVVRGWHLDLPPRAKWPALLDAAHDVREAAVVAAAVVVQAVDAGVEDGWLSSVPAGRGALWLRRAGWSSAEPDASKSNPHRLSGRRAAVIDRWRQRWGAADDRLVWLNTLLLVHENRARAADPRLPATVAASLLRASLEPASSPHSAPHRHLDAAHDRTSTRRTAGGEPFALPAEHRHRDSSPVSDVRLGAEHTRQSTRADRLAASAAASPGLPIRGEPFVHRSDADAAHAPESAEDAKPERFDRRTPSGHFTQYAGLLFLVPILERLEFATFLAAHPAFLEMDFPAQLMSFIGCRTGLTPDDPLATALACEPAGGFDRFDIAHLPARARDILAVPKPRTAVDSPLAAWTTAVRRWCRRHARQGLTALIRRPGRIEISRTHIGVCFGLSQLDVRLRRLALDVDPGWVPWMGRVVQFSYLEAS